MNHRERDSGRFTITEIVREDAGPEWTIRYGSGGTVSISRDDVLAMKATAVLAPGNEQSITIESHRLVIHTDADTLASFQQWAGINVELPYTGITRTDGVYQLVVPDGCEGTQPVVTFASNQIGFRIRLRIDDRPTYKISPDTRVITLCGPTELIEAIRNGTTLPSLEACTPA